MERGRTRQRSESRSSSRSESRNNDEDSIGDEDVQFDLFSPSSLKLFLKCVIFSIIATILLLAVTNYNEVMFIMRNLQSSNAKNIDVKSQNFSTSNDATIYTITIPDECRSMENRDQENCRNILSSEMKEAFERDGVIAIRGLLSPEEIDKLDTSSLQLMGLDPNALGKDARPLKVSGASSFSGKQFFSTIHHAIFESDKNGFADVALNSLLPQVASELMNMNRKQNETNGDNLRLIRDVFLAKDQDPYICGWHVDDTGFWPTPFDADGINAWIAIDSIPSSSGGGFALSVGSHKADWRFDAFKLTGSTYTLPEDGYIDAEDMFNNRGVGTCNIKNATPKLNKLIEERKRIYDVQAGDVILHTRWLFHRTVQVERKMAKELDRDREKILYRRYSVRYSPGSATLTKGYGVELSTLYNPELGGQPLDTVSKVDGPWYPKCWPNIDHSEIESMPSIVPKMKQAEEVKKLKMKEMKPFLQEMGRQQRKKILDNARNMGADAKPQRNRGDGSAKIMHMINSQDSQEEEESSEL